MQRDRFDPLGVAENTLIFFLGDNGSDGPLGHEHAVACAAPLRGKKERRNLGDTDWKYSRHVGDRGFFGLGPPTDTGF